MSQPIVAALLSCTSALGATPSHPAAGPHAPEEPPPVESAEEASGGPGVDVPPASEGGEPAAEPAVSGDCREATDRELEQARTLFESGVAAYEAAEYDKAVSLWYEALSWVPRTRKHRKVRAELIYNVARAQAHAYEIDGDVRHLRQARRALRRFLEEVDAIYPESDRVAEHAATQAQLAAIDRQIEAWEAEQKRKERERLEALRPKFDPVLDAQQRRRNLSVLGTGTAAVVLGAGGLGLMGGGLFLAARAERDLAGFATGADLPGRRDVLARGELGQRLAIAGAAVGGVLLAVGIPMVIAGAVFEKRRKDYRERLSVGSGGLVVRFRFAVR